MDKIHNLIILGLYDRVGGGKGGVYRYYCLLFTGQYLLHPSAERDSDDVKCLANNCCCTAYTHTTLTLEYFDYSFSNFQTICHFKISETFCFVHFCQHPFH